MNQQLVLINLGRLTGIKRETEHGIACQMPDGRWIIEYYTMNHNHLMKILAVTFIIIVFMCIISISNTVHGKQNQNG